MKVSLIPWGGGGGEREGGGGLLALFHFLVYYTARFVEVCCRISLARQFQCQPTLHCSESH